MSKVKSEMTLDKEHNGVGRERQRREGEIKKRKISDRSQKNTSSFGARMAHCRWSTFEMSTLTDHVDDSFKIKSN